MAFFDDWWYSFENLWLLNRSDYCQRALNDLSCTVLLWIDSIHINIPYAHHYSPHYNWSCTPIKICFFSSIFISFIKKRRLKIIKYVGYIGAILYFILYRLPLIYINCLFFQVQKYNYFFSYFSPMWMGPLWASNWVFQNLWWWIPTLWKKQNKRRTFWWNLRRTFFQKRKMQWRAMSGSSAR